MKRKNGHMGDVRNEFHWCGTRNWNCEDEGDGQLVLYNVLKEDRGIIERGIELHVNFCPFCGAKSEVFLDKYNDLRISDNTPDHIMQLKRIIEKMEKSREITVDLPESWIIEDDGE